MKRHFFILVIVVLTIVMKCHVFYVGAKKHRPCMLIYSGFEVFSGDDVSLLLGMVTLVAAVATLSRILLLPAMMMYHSKPISLCDNNDNNF
ncbi:hypothetical protein Hanom_Chr12g01179651 [Helianthus anomalus]